MPRFIAPGLAPGLALVAVAACEPAEPLVDYSPVIDRSRVDMAAFERDLPECRAIGQEVYDQYLQEAGAEFMANLLIGIVAGGIAGAAAGGDDYIAQGAAIGAAGAGVRSAYDHVDLSDGPEGIVDACMTNRGHEVLSPA